MINRKGRRFWVTAMALVALCMPGCEGRLLKIETSVMAPTVTNGSRLVLNRKWTSIQRGDVVVFTMPTSRQSVSIMRVYAIAGDTVQYDARAEKLMVLDSNGSRVSHAPVSIDAKHAMKIEEQLGPGKLFVMGDNMYDSFDSRYWGLLDEARVLGVVPASAIAGASDAKWRAMAVGEEAIIQ